MLVCVRVPKKRACKIMRNRTFDEMPNLLIFHMLKHINRDEAKGSIQTY